MECFVLDNAKQQAVVSDSNGVADYYGMCCVAADQLMLQHLLRFLGFNPQCRLFVHSSAAKAISTRQGLGRLKYLEVKML